ncbi:MAG: hypothetical protein AAB913_03365 [Patescibacteria group bacterium]
MENKRKKELIYSVVFFLVANAVLFGDLLYKIHELLMLLPLNIKSKFLFSGLSPAFEKIISLDIFIVVFSLLCSIYFSIQSLRKIPTNDKRKILGLIPNSISGGLPFVLIFISSLLMIIIIIQMFSVYSA